MFQASRGLNTVIAALILSVYIIIAPSAAQTFQVGVSPDSVNLGEVDPGSVHTVRFNIITPSEEPLTVKLEAEKIGRDAVSPGTMQEYSEEDPAPWATFIENPTTLSKSDRPEGAEARSFGWRQVSFLLQIPADAEPGYHMFKVTPIPWNTISSGVWVRPPRRMTFSPSHAAVCA